MRVGRVVRGSIDLIRDLVEQGRGILLLGPPGSGKTTKLREVAAMLADELGKRVVIILNPHFQSAPFGGVYGNRD